jgi:5'-3' exonuclease
MPSDLAEQIPWVKRTLEAFRIATLERPGYEADDLLAALALRARGLVEVVLVTQDKDALQLVGPRVRVMSLAGRAGERVTFDEAKVEERWGVAPDRIPDLLALTGDQVDNIPGVPGVGEVTAVKLLHQFGRLENLFQSLPLVANDKLRETLARHREQAFQARDLIRLADLPDLQVDLDQFRRQEPDWKALRALWEELQFSSLLKNVPGHGQP